MMRTFQLLHLELLRLELLGSAVSPSAGPAIAGQPPASSAEDQDVGAQASRIEHRRLTTLPSGRRAYQSRKLCSPMEIARAPSDPTSSRFSRAPSVSTRASAMCVLHELYPIVRNDIETPPSTGTQDQRTLGSPSHFDIRPPRPAHTEY